MVRKCAIYSNFNPLPNNTILALSKLKAFADDNFYLAQMVQFLFDREENILRKGENTGFQHFLLSLNVFKKSLSQGCQKSGLCGKGLTNYHMTKF